MKFFFFGTCAGTEPIDGWFHTSFAAERNGFLYWFDAGENCSRTAYLMGIDLLKTRKICISHTHMDHIGGLGNLLWNIRKVGLHKDFPSDGIEVFIPETEVFKSIRTLLSYTEGGYTVPFTLSSKEITDGFLFSENGLTVSAMHNNHLPREEGAPYKSFGFEMKFDGKRVVYSGDVQSMEDVKNYLTEKTDVLLVETGHHNPINVCETVFGFENAPEKIYFLHNGKAIRDDENGVREEMKNRYGNRVQILFDKDIIEL